MQGRPERSHKLFHRERFQRMQDNRIHYLENLQAIAMMLGVSLHAGFAYAQQPMSYGLQLKSMQVRRSIAASGLSTYSA